LHDHLDAEKAFDKIKYAFIIKVLKKLGLSYLNLVDNIYNKTIANIITNGDNLKVIPLKSGTK
jgi:hypothetical protein